MKNLLILCGFLACTVSLLGQDSKNLPDYEKGSWLFHACKADVRNMDSSNGGEVADLDLANECLDYFGGFSEALLLKKSTLCTGNASIGTMVRVYVDYMEKHPKLLDEHRGIGLFISLTENYPCAKSSK